MILSNQTIQRKHLFTFYQFLLTKKFGRLCKYFEEAPRGLKNLLTGKNNGKVIVKVSPENQVQAKL